ncbi:glutathione-disulfide reductase [Heliomarina baculiformis]|uniref:glutathione-disulfide reductase n=1 Tax=Heliomarina baculiformis TaxID=2872036 RepID=UPI001EE284B0|nr:glutathione-disulfide reductase [Heliomarina baculiformis]
MMSFDYDLFVIGGGSGGVRAARVAAGEANAKVALAEEDRYGGTCVIRGCVPKKLMVYASSYADMPEIAAHYGWEINKGAFNWESFRGHLNSELDRLEGVYRKLLKNSGVDSFDQRARIKDAHTVELDNGDTYTAKHILVATGGRPVRPELENAELGIVSDDIFHLETLPKSMLIVGGGYIACEFACILHGLGVEVTQYYRGEQILRGFDDEARELIASSMKERGIDLQVETDISALAPAGDDRDGPVRVTRKDGEEVEFDMVFFATGRRPNTVSMGLEEVGVKLGRSSEIEVDEYSQTAVPSIYAIGDVTDRVNLTPVAIREGMAFVETVFKGNPTPVDHALIPSAVFTQPELGTVGLTEGEAAKLGAIDVYATSFRPMQTAFADKPEKVLMKLIVSQESRKILGCHIVAPDAGELIQMAGIAIKMGATKEDFDRTVAVHPTMSEEIVTMRSPTRSG